MNPEEKNLALICHGLGLAGFLIPFSNVIAPLIFWLMKKDTSPVVARHGKESLNFQITVTIAALAASVLVLVGIGVFLLPVVAVGNLIFVVLAMVKVSSGEDYTYPICLRLVS